MSSEITAREAQARLATGVGATPTPEELRRLAAEVSVDSPGRVTVLYSGNTAQGVHSTDVVNAMRAAGEDVRIIDRSQAARFLQSDAFNDSVARAFNISPEQLKSGPEGASARAWLYHPTEGPWADASARFAEQTRGEVKLLVNGADPQRVFGATELPRILANPNVTTIEGIPRETLVARQASHGTQAAFEMVVARSHENAGLIRTAVNAQGLPLRGDNGHLQLDSRTYFQGTEIEGRPPTTTQISRPMADLMGTPNAHVIAGQQHIDELARATPGLRTGSSPGLGRLGTGATIVGAALTLAEGNEAAQRSSALHEMGNTTGANSELIHFGARTVGAWGGAALGAGVGAAGTSWSGPGALIGGIVGGAAGLVGGQYVADYLDHRKIYRQEDADGKTWAFDPENPNRGWHRSETIEQRAPNGQVVEQRRDVVASGVLAAQLDRQATTVSLELMLARPPVPRDPYALPAGPGDAVSATESPWRRDPASGDWRRGVYEWRTDTTEPGFTTLREVVTADPARAAQLEAQSQAILRDNVHLSPAAMAARYELAHRDKGWDSIGALPESAQNAVRNDSRLVASDGAEYQRLADGTWERQALFGLTTATASATTRAELDATRGLLQEGLREHRAMMAERPQPAPPTFEETMQRAAGRAYAAQGLAPNEAELQTMGRAMAADFNARGLDGPFMLQLERDPVTKQYGLGSPMGLYTRGDDGDMSLRFTMTPQEAREVLAAPSRAEATPRDPLNESMREFVHAMDRNLGRVPDGASDCVAAMLAVKWRETCPSISPTGVVLGQKGARAEAGEFVFAYAGTPERPTDWVGVRTAEAVRTPVEQSLAKAEALAREQAMEAQQVAQVRQQEASRAIV
jgi:hypothetical protein